MLLSCVSLTGTKTKKFEVDAALSIYSKDYVTGSDGFDVVMTLNGNTLNKITGAADLTEGTDYTKSGNVIHFKDEYLKNITGTQGITFTFSAGAEQVLKVTVVPAADGATVILAERELAKNASYFDGNNDVDTKANDGTEEGAIVIADPTAPITNLIAAQFAISNSARLGFIDFELGNDTIAYNEKVGTLEIKGTVTPDENSYVLKLQNLPKFDQYTVFISGDGYRDAKVQFALNENTTVNFWNNANDSALNYVVKEISGTEKTITKNFLAGDVIMNGGIDLYDLSAVSSYFGKGNLQVGDDAYVQYDLNRDHNINILDITMLLAGWAE